MIFTSDVVVVDGVGVGTGCELHVNALRTSSGDSSILSPLTRDANPLTIGVENDVPCQ